MLVADGKNTETSTLSCDNNGGLKDEVAYEPEFWWSRPSESQQRTMTSTAYDLEVTGPSPVLEKMLTQTNGAEGCSQQAKSQHIVSSCLEWYFLRSVLTQILICPLCWRGTSTGYWSMRCTHSNRKCSWQLWGRFNCALSHLPVWAWQNARLSWGSVGLTIMRWKPSVVTWTDFQIILFWRIIQGMWFIMKSNNTWMT